MFMNEGVECGRKGRKRNMFNQKTSDSRKNKTIRQQDFMIY